MITIALICAMLETTRILPTAAKTGTERRCHREDAVWISPGSSEEPIEGVLREIADQ